MAFKFQRANKQFFLLGKASLITETQYGYAEESQIIYPGVSSCTTITLLLEDTAIGMHLTKADPATDVDAIVDQLKVVRAGRPVRKMYAVGALLSKSTGWKGEARYTWPMQLSTFNTSFGRNAGDLVAGYIQQEGTEQEYRAVVAAGASEMTWSAKSKGSQAWESLTLVAGALQICGVK
jgi:hypothetical protein